MMLLDLFFPPTCFYCHQLHTSNKLLCDICLTGLDLLHTPGRCRECFSPYIAGRRCLFCKESPPPFYRQAALFDQGTAARPFINDVERFGKEIAAFFMVQWINLRWPLPRYIAAEKGVSSALRPFQKFLQMERLPRFFPSYGGDLLFLHRDRKIDGKDLRRLQGFRVFGLALMKEE